MSKTSERRSTFPGFRACWRQCAASATAFARRYKRDLFFRTELNVVALQALFTLVVLGLIALGFAVLYRDVSSNLLTSLMTGIGTGSATTTSAFIANELEYLRYRNVILISSAIIVVTAFFGWLMVRLALMPTRNALEAQKQFIGNIAHELRTPLSIIKTNTEVALFDESLPHEARATLDSTVEELDRVSDIINNLLSINALLKPESMALANVDLGVVVDRALKHLEPLLSRKRLVVKTHKSDYRTVWGNQSALQQVVTNLVKNAASYSADGGSVRVSMQPDYRGHIELSVEDSGIGIAEKDLSRIFEPFYRADQSRTRASGGSGLGLAIVSELVKLHKGKIVITSALKEGTTVLVSLPCGREEAAAPENGGEGGATSIEVDFSRGPVRPE